MSFRLASPLLLLLTVLSSALAWARLPERVPVHWDLHGTANRWGSRWELLLLGPGLIFFISALCLVLGRVDPRLREEDDGRPREAVWTLSLLLMAAIHVVILAHVTGLLANTSRAAALIFAGFLLLLGNVLGRVRPNWFAGIRTPWTLSSDENWRRTHRFGGRMMFGGGLLAALGALVLPPAAAFAFTIVVLLTSTLTPAAYSYFIWRAPEAGEGR